MEAEIYVEEVKMFMSQAIKTANSTPTTTSRIIIEQATPLIQTPETERDTVAAYHGTSTINSPNPTRKTPPSRKKSPSYMISASWMPGTRREGIGRSIVGLFGLARYDQALWIVPRGRQVVQCGDSQWDS